MYNLSGWHERFLDQMDILKAFNEMKRKGNWTGIQYILNAPYIHYDDLSKKFSFRALIANNTEHVPDTPVECILIPTDPGVDRAKILVIVGERVHTTILVSNVEETSDFLAHFLFPGLGHGGVSPNYASISESRKRGARSPSDAESALREVRMRTAQYTSDSRSSMMGSGGSQALSSNLDSLCNTQESIQMFLEFYCIPYEKDYGPKDYEHSHVRTFHLTGTGYNVSPHSRVGYDISAAVNKTPPPNVYYGPSHSQKFSTARQLLHILIDDDVLPPQALSP